MTVEKLAQLLYNEIHPGRNWFAEPQGYGTYANKFKRAAKALIDTGTVTG